MGSRRKTFHLFVRGIALEMVDKRESWGSTLSFIFACVGYSVGLGNIWRFPYLAYKSGGGAFLIPFAVMLVFCGVPLLYMELAVGQYTRRGPIGALGKLTPILKGAGVATVVMTFLMTTYYNVIMSWALFYFKESFSSTLPWEHCNNDWNSKYCRPIKGISTTNGTKGKSNTHSSTQEFYDRRMLSMTSGIEEMGSFNLELFLLLVVAWVLVYFCIWKGVKATGKIVYITVSVPYILLLIFTVRGVTLEGALDGLKFFFKPNWSELLKPHVWVYAAAQVFNSVGIAFGSHIAFASYKDFKGPILRNALIVTIIDAFTCILCGICVFSTMGNLAYIQGTTVSKVVTEGPGLVFVVFPHALSYLPFPQVWSAIFFGMLICLGIDSQFAMVEVVLTSIKDGYGKLIEKYVKRHELLVLIICLVSLICGLPNMFDGGIYYFTLLDYYVAAISLMYIALFETIAIVWCYGTSRLSANIEDMTGKRPHGVFRFCWIFVSPLLILVIWMFTLINYQAPSYNNGAYTYPWWCIILGWLITSLSIIPIPFFALEIVSKTKGGNLYEKLCNSFVSKIITCPCCDSPLDVKMQAHVDNEKDMEKM